MSFCKSFNQGSFQSAFPLTRAAVSSFLFIMTRLSRCKARHQKLGDQKAFYFDTKLHGNNE